MTASDTAQVKRRLQELEAAGWHPRRSQGPFTQIVGPVWAKEEGDGQSCYGLLIEERHTNSAGIAHGGMLMTLADHVLGWMVWDAVRPKRCVTISLNNQFIGAAKPGDFVEMRARIRRQTRSLVFVEGQGSIDGKLMLSSEGIWKILGEG